MTKKHFVALATVTMHAIRTKTAARLKSAFHADCPQLTADLMAIVADEMADFCQSQNVQFDRERFLAACGVK